MTEWSVLVNPVAGRLTVDTATVVEALEHAGVDARVEVIDGVDRFRQIAVDRAGAGDAVAVVGGDGTVSTAVDAMMDAGIRPRHPIGILPTGTGCDLLRTFGRGGDLLEAARRLTRGSPYPIDVGVLDGAWGRRHFVNVAQVGVGAAAVESAQRLPRWIGAGRYPLAFAARLPRFPQAAVRIEADRWEAEPTRALAVILANGQFFAGGWNIAPKAIMGDGVLDVQRVAVPKTRAPTLVPKLIRGLHLREPGIRRRATATLRIETDPPWPIEADGDVVGHTPVAVGVIRQAIELQI